MTETISLPSKEDIVEALEAVHDPHVPVSLRRMGMLRDIEIDADGDVRFRCASPAWDARVSACFAKTFVKQCCQCPALKVLLSKKDGTCHGRAT